MVTEGGTCCDSEGFHCVANIKLLKSEGNREGLFFKCLNNVFFQSLLFQESQLVTWIAKFLTFQFPFLKLLHIWFYQAVKCCTNLKVKSQHFRQFRHPFSAVSHSCLFSAPVTKLVKPISANRKSSSIDFFPQTQNSKPYNQFQFQLRQLGQINAITKQDNLRGRMLLRANNFLRHGVKHPASPLEHSVARWIIECIPGVWHPRSGELLSLQHLWVQSRQA